MQIHEALKLAQGLGVARLDAQLLLVHVLTAVAPPPGRPQDITRSWLLAHDDRALAPLQAQAWAALLQRRAAGEPLAYVIGEQAFCGLRLQVSPAVLIPRPETEGLVQWAVECLQAVPRPAPRVLDLGTGSGAVALAIKHRCAQADVVATDISSAALAVAAGNARRLQLAVAFQLADWWAAADNAAADAAGFSHSQPTSAGRFDLVVSNPPYITPGDCHLSALQHEPITALIGAGDGLDDLRTIISGSPQRLAPGAWLLLEHGHNQAQAVQTLLLQAGLEAPQTRVDLAGLPRCTGARWPLPPASGGAQETEKWH